MYLKRDCTNEIANLSKNDNKSTNKKNKNNIADLHKKLTHAHAHAHEDAVRTTTRELDIELNRGSMKP